MTTLKLSGMPRFRYREGVSEWRLETRNMFFDFTFTDFSMAEEAGFPVSGAVDGDGDQDDQAQSETQEEQCGTR